MTPLATHLSAFLTEYLPRDRGASQHTIDAYAQVASASLRCGAALDHSIEDPPRTD